MVERCFRVNGGMMTRWWPLKPALLLMLLDVLNLSVSRNWNSVVRKRARKPKKRKRKDWRRLWVYLRAGGGRYATPAIVARFATVLALRRKPPRRTDRKKFPKSIFFTKNVKKYIYIYIKKNDLGEDTARYVTAAAKR